MNADWPSQLWPPLVMRFVLLIRLMQFNEAGYRNSWHGHGATTRQNYHCYSCMTKEFETNWNNLERIYYRPRNFTDHCLSLPRNANIGIAPCPHSVCVSVVEPRILAGHHIGNNVIRGCFSSVFRYGATRQLLRVKNRGPGTSFCLRYPANRLLPPHLARKGSNRTLQLCACYGQLCNEFPTVVASSVAAGPLLCQLVQFGVITLLTLCSFAGTT